MMVQNENIICVSYSTWDGPYTKSVIQLMSLLGLHNTVLYVEYPFTIKDLVYTLLGKQQAPIARMLGLKPRAVTKKTAEGAEVINWVLPPILPVNAIKNEWLYRTILMIDTWIYRKSLKRAAKKFNLGSPVVVNAYNPIFGEKLAGKLNEKATIYYCYDGFSRDRRGIRAWKADRSFSETADGIIVTSDFLKAQKQIVNRNVKTVKNGVDFELFNRSAKKEPQTTGARRKIGYIGSIDQRFDLETVEFAVKNLPLYDFEFIGDVRNIEVKEKLECYPNVAFLPPVNPAEVPARLKQCDAGIIPYLCNEINKNVYPLKINEYLATGVPVVLTPFADLPEFAEHVSFADSAQTFLDSLVSVVENDNVEKIKSRIRFARSNSWISRADEFSSAIIDFCSTKKTAA
jgi:teichuronic acid biosynthesis glycosyltransferase TuaH